MAAPWKRYALMLAMLFFCLPPAGHGASNQRLALVIGNGAYRTLPLKNPVNDAVDMAGALRKLGFEVVLRTDVGLKPMEKAIKAFGRDLRRGGVGLFYFAGHGMQVEGRNYLIPADADIESESDVRFESVDAGRVLGKMEDAGNALNIVILDACRDNPFARSFRSGTQGLARMDAPKGSIIAYATAPGSVAADGHGRNGIYTKNLLAHIDSPGLSIETFFKKVRIGVISETQDRQVPWESSSLTGDFFFSRKRGLVVQAVEKKTPAPPLSGRPSVTPSVKKDAGPKAESRETRLAMGSRPGKSVARELTRHRPEINNALGMTFAFVSPGSFTMGSPGTETGREQDERRHRVTLTRGFFMQTTEVTRTQWEAVMGGHSSDAKDCGGDCPVVSVSWNEAQAFIEKLNRLEGAGRYRLPREAEWEYACRAGRATAFSGGGIRKTGCSREPGLASYGWYCRNAGGHPRPVGKKTPNAWGLYDMHGNVGEWCQDRFGAYPAGPVSDPAGPGQGACRTFRGGSWADGAGACRSAVRNCQPADFRGNHLGFRLVRNP
jgi:formylglycine-generating enzyme required for sulfatase activity